MHFYSEYSCDETSFDKKKLWDPLKTLGIINPDPAYQCITCIGYAPSCRRRCRNPIRADNRAFITQVIDEIAYLDPQSPAVISRLREIAGPALCVRYHQNQEHTVLSKWQEAIKQVKPRVEAYEDTKPAQSTKQDIKTEPVVEDAKDLLRELRELLAELQEERRKGRQQSQEYERPENHTKNCKEEPKYEGSVLSELWRLRSEQEEREGKEKKRQEKERQEKEKQERERKEKERAEKERQEQERKARARKEEEEKKQEEKRQREREREAQNERIRQRAQKRREEEERQKAEKAQKEREEWDQLWARYQDGWKKFRSCKSREGNLRDAIPWPVKSGSYKDVRASDVREFLQTAPPKNIAVAKLMRQECLKWHPDKVNNWLQGAELSDVDRMMIDMICREVTGILDGNVEKSSKSN
ncbi:hypothetical protein B0O99DRAFT_685414 [Bisporella sp. PMI_857]|nr:hypothetical protein B0O99DRAFT_685414 [Bisporella sp. PMI_857]